MKVFIHDGEVYIQSQPMRPVCLVCEPDAEGNVSHGYCRFHMLTELRRLELASWYDRLELFVRTWAWPVYEYGSLAVIISAFAYLAIHLYWWHAVGYRVVGR